MYAVLRGLIDNVRQVFRGHESGRRLIKVGNATRRASENNIEMRNLRQQHVCQHLTPDVDEHSISNNIRHRSTWWPPLLRCHWHNPQERRPSHLHCRCIRGGCDVCYGTVRMRFSSWVGKGTLNIENVRFTPTFFSFLTTSLPPPQPYIWHRAIDIPPPGQIVGHLQSSELHLTSYWAELKQPPIGRNQNQIGSSHFSPDRRRQHPSRRCSASHIGSSRCSQDACG